MSRSSACPLTLTGPADPPDLPGEPGERTALLEDLRAHIRALEVRTVSFAPTEDTASAGLACAGSGHGGRSPSQSLAANRSRPLLRFGVAAIDGVLPRGGLGGGVHGLCPASYRDSLAPRRLALTLLARAQNQPAHQAAHGDDAGDAPGREAKAAWSSAPILWCVSRLAMAEFGRPYAPGLARAGLAVDRLVLVEAARTKDGLWAAEEGLRAGGLAAVVLELDDASPTALRRLALAAQSHGTACLIIPHHRAQPTASLETRWRLSTAEAPPDRYDPAAPGAGAVAITLEKCRHGPAGRTWWMEFCDGPAGFSVAAPVCDRALPDRASAHL